MVFNFNHIPACHMETKAWYSMSIGLEGYGRMRVACVILHCSNVGDKIDRYISRSLCSL